MADTRAQIIEKARAGLTDKHLPGRVMLFLPGGWTETRMKRIDGNAGPWGKCMAEFYGTPGVYVSFDAREVLDYMEGYLINA